MAKTGEESAERFGCNHSNSTTFANVVGSRLQIRHSVHFCRVLKKKKIDGYL